MSARSFSQREENNFLSSQLLHYNLFFTSLVLRASVEQLLFIVKRNRNLMFVPSFCLLACSSRSSLRRNRKLFLCSLQSFSIQFHPKKRNKITERAKEFRRKVENFYCFFAIFRKTKVFNGKFIIYAFCTLFFCMNNCSERRM